VYELARSVEETELVPAASVVGEAMPCGGGGAAEPFGDAVPGVATDASVDDDVRKTSLGLGDEG